MPLNTTNFTTPEHSVFCSHRMTQSDDCPGKFNSDYYPRVKENVHMLSTPARPFHIDPSSRIRHFFHPAPLFCINKLCLWMGFGSRTVFTSGQREDPPKPPPFARIEGGSPIEKVCNGLLTFHHPLLSNRLHGSSWQAFRKGWSDSPSGCNYVKKLQFLHLEQSEPLETAFGKASELSHGKKAESQKHSIIERCRFQNVCDFPSLN